MWAFVTVHFLRKGLLDETKNNWFCLWFRLGVLSRTTRSYKVIFLERNLLFSGEMSFLSKHGIAGIIQFLYAAICLSPVATENNRFKMIHLWISIYTLQRVYVYYLLYTCKCMISRFTLNPQKGNSAFICIRLLTYSTCESIGMVSTTLLF